MYPLLTAAMQPRVVQRASKLCTDVRSMLILKPKRNNVTIIFSFSVTVSLMNSMGNFPVLIFTASELDVVRERRESGQSAGERETETERQNVTRKRDTHTRTFAQAHKEMRVGRDMKPNILSA